MKGFLFPKRFDVARNILSSNIIHVFEIAKEMLTRWFLALLDVQQIGHMSSKIATKSSKIAGIRDILFHRASMCQRKI